MLFDKRYFEKYALLTIADCLNLNRNDFKIQDKPDIQNDVDSIGIEVTRAITQHQGFTIALANKHFGKGKSGIAIKKEIEGKHPDFKGSVTIIDEDIAVISPSKGMTDTQDHLIVAREAILDKEIKRKDYKVFDKNYLYLFLETSIFGEDEIAAFISDLAKEVTFDGFYINCIDKIFFYEYEEIRVFEITYQRLKEYKDEAQI